MIRSFRITKTDIKKAVQEVMSSRMYTLSTTPQRTIDRLYESVEIVSKAGSYTSEDLPQIFSAEDVKLELDARWNEGTGKLMVYVNQPFIKGQVLEEDQPVIHKALVDSIKQSEFVVNDSYDIDAFL